MRRALLLLPVVITLAPTAAWAQGNPVGPEFRVNTYITGGQYGGTVAFDGSGNFVVAWGSQGQDGDDGGAFAQRYDSSGAPAGPEFRVNSYTTGYQGSGIVAAAANGGFVIVWAGGSFDRDVFGQRYDSSGAPLGGEFRVNSYTTSLQSQASVATAANGDFVVVWMSAGQDGDWGGIFGQRFAATGAPLGPEFRVNTYTTLFQTDPWVASDPSGNFVVTWDSMPQDGSGLGVFAQRYASGGTPAGAEFRVNTNTQNHQSRSRPFYDAGGRFVVVWDSLLQDGAGYGVYAQRYDATGTPLGPEFRVNATTPGSQWFPFGAADGAGDFVVVWVSDAQDGSGYGVFGQRYASSGASLGPEFRVNTFTTNGQTAPFPAVAPAGTFIVLWNSDGQDGSSFGKFAQRYGQILPVELMHFTLE